MAKVSKKVPAHTYRFSIPIQIDRIAEDDSIDFCVAKTDLVINIRALTVGRARDKFSKAILKSLGIKTKGNVSIYL